MLIPAQLYREFQVRLAMAKRMRQKVKSRVPRCLFGPSNPKEDAKLLRDTLDNERTRFSKRWGVDPLDEEEDKENGPCDCARLTPSKRRASPYNKQTSIRDYWRERKSSDSKMSPTTGENARPQPRPLVFSPVRVQLRFDTEFNAMEIDAPAEALPQNAESDTFAESDEKRD